MVLEGRMTRELPAVPLVFATCATLPLAHCCAFPRPKGRLCSLAFPHGERHF